jgi:hypothetical protein
MQLVLLLAALVSAPKAYAADFGIYGADQQKMAVVGWSADESHVAIRQFDIRSAKFTAANPRSTTGCPGYTLPNGAAFDGTEQIILYKGNRIISRVPIKDGGACTHPDDITGREQTAANFLQSAGVTIGKKGKAVALTGSPGSQGFVFHDNRFKFGGETEPVSGNNHKINGRLRSVNATFEYPFTISSPNPSFTWGLDSVVQSPSGKRAILIGFVDRDGDRALGVVDILKYDNGTIGPAQ